MEFLRPTSRQFPVDEVCSQIVAALEKRHWNVPGIKVKLGNYGSGDQKLRYVSSIEGANFHLHFCRIQRLMPGGILNDIAAVNEIRIPQKILRVYNDESGPTLWMYVGDNWEADRTSFFADYDYDNCRPRDKPRISARYSGDPTWVGERASVLKRRWSNDVESELLHTSDVMDEFRTHLHDIVLASIEATPIPSDPFDVLAVPAKVPLPAGMGPFFARADHRDGARIKRGQSDSRNDLHLVHRFGLAPDYRLVTIGTRQDGTFPEVAYDGFIWCGLEHVEVNREGAPGERFRFDCEYVIRITPTCANDIYIADHGAYEKARATLAAAIKGQRDQFTDQEVCEFERVRARTLIPITDYKGGYTQPLVLIGRELAFDEVEIVREPLPGGRR